MRSQPCSFYRRWYRVCADGLVASTVIIALFFTLSAYASTGPLQQYLGLGDSLAYGFQPNGVNNDGYVQQFYTHLRNNYPSLTLTDYGCGGESSSQMIVTYGCPSGNIHDQWPNFNTTSQLTGALSLIGSSSLNQVSPVTLDIGGNDMTPSFTHNTCEYGNTGPNPLASPPPPSWTTELATLDQNLTQASTGILPRLTSALQANGRGDLIMLNYYNYLDYTYPLPQGGNATPACPNAIPYVQQLNQHLAHDAAQTYALPIVFVDDWSAFQPNTICAASSTHAYTWWCSLASGNPPNLHATASGYGAMANAIEAAYGH